MLNAGSSLGSEIKRRGYTIWLSFMRSLADLEIYCPITGVFSTLAGSFLAVKSSFCRASASRHALLCGKFELAVRQPRRFRRTHYVTSRYQVANRPILKPDLLMKIGP